MQKSILNTLILIFFCLIFFLSCSISAWTNMGPASNPLPVSASSIELLNNLSDNMVARWQSLDNQCSPNAVFALLYIYMTKGGRDFVQAGYFEDGDAMTNLIYVFAQRYINAFDAYAAGNLPSPPWQAAFNFSATNRSSAIQNMMLGVNAHINYDLGIAVNTSNYGLSESRKRDYDRVNDLMGNVTEPSLCDIGTRYDASLKPGAQSVVENPLTLELLVNWRNNAWTNAEKLHNGTTTYEQMSAYTVAVAMGFNTPSLTSTSTTRVPYCVANHNTAPDCPTAIFRKWY